MFDQVLELCVTESDGAKESLVSSREVYGDELSIRSADFNAAQALGKKLEVGLKIRRIEYNGESVVRYNDKYYNVHRTYSKDKDWIELYLNDGRVSL